MAINVSAQYNGGLVVHVDYISKFILDSVLSCLVLVPLHGD